jgi:hypothetical protein
MSEFFTEEKATFTASSASATQSPPPPPASFKKAKWTPEEDERLRENVEIHGLGNWAIMSQGLPGRNGKQCRERWMNQLCPALNKDNWTTQEDTVLVQQQRIYGNVWSRIARFLPGRSPNAVKNRWSWLSRHAISSAMAMRMIQQRPPPRIVMPEFATATAPPDMQWYTGSPLIQEGVAPVAFSNPAEMTGGFQFGGALSDVDAPIGIPDRFFRESDEQPKPFEDWAF